MGLAMALKHPVSAAAPNAAKTWQAARDVRWWEVFFLLFLLLFSLYFFLPLFDIEMVLAVKDGCGGLAWIVEFGNQE